MPFLTIDDWEAHLESIGPLADLGVLQEMYKHAPNGAPSRGLLRDWLLSHGVNPGA